MFISIFFIIYKVINISVNFKSFITDYTFYIKTSVVSIFMSLSVFILAHNWYSILNFLTNKKNNYSIINLCYTKSNIGKYLPGNVMQFVGRALLKEHMEISMSTIAISTTLDIFFLLITAITLSVILSYEELLKQLSRIENLTQLKIIFIILILVIVCSFIFYIIKNKYELGKLKMFCNMQFIQLFIKVFLNNIVVFLIHSSILIIIFYYIIKINVQGNVYLIISSYIISWLIGFCVPGSPGGIGIRESILIFLLSNNLGADKVTIAVFIHRIISILSDILAFIYINIKK